MKNNTKKLRRRRTLVNGVKVHVVVPSCSPQIQKLLHISDTGFSLLSLESNVCSKEDRASFNRSATLHQSWKLLCLPTSHIMNISPTASYGTSSTALGTHSFCSAGMTQSYYNHQYTRKLHLHVSLNLLSCGMCVGDVVVQGVHRVKDPATVWAFVRLTHLHLRWGHRYWLFSRTVQYFFLAVVMSGVSVAICLFSSGRSPKGDLYLLRKSIKSTGLCGAMDVFLVDTLLCYFVDAAGLRFRFHLRTKAVKGAL